MEDSDQPSGGIHLNLTSGLETAQTFDSADINKDGPEVVKERSGKKRGDGKKKQEQHTDVISSLFHHNPTIPRIQQGDVVPTKEDVFSVNTFDELQLDVRIVKNLADLGITKLTTIQALALPVILGGKDALVKSQTGSGKTLTYAVPIIQKLGEKNPRVERKDGCYALVIVPTRELAVQTYEWFQKLCRTYIWIVPGLLVGGEGRKAEKARLRKGVNILVSTPGRLVDHLGKTENLRLDRVEWVVLDEADRMLELGYERDVRSVLDALQRTNQLTRQSLLLSATLTQGIEQLSEVSLRHPVFLDAAGEGGPEEKHNLSTPVNLKQTFLLVPAKLKLVALGSFVLWKCQQSKGKKMLVFFPTQDMVDFYTKFLEIVLWGQDDRVEEEEEDNLNMNDDAAELMEARRLEMEESGGGQASRGRRVAGLDTTIKLLKLHGNMSQKDRMTVFQEFRIATSGVLLCTDVAARGLDLPLVDWIVQFTAPISTADYVHRVGRTARIGASGSSVIFLLPSEAGFIKQLERDQIPLLEMTLEQVLQKLLKSGITSTKSGQPAHTMEEAATNLQMRIENAVVRDKELYALACQAYVSFVRSYASYPKEVRNVFCFKELHLGHCAKSFALRDPPKKVTGIGKGQWVENQERRQRSSKLEEKIIRAQKRRINEKSLILSEFSTGFQGISEEAKRIKLDKKKKQKVGKVK